MKMCLSGVDCRIGESLSAMPILGGYQAYIKCIRE